MKTFLSVEMMTQVFDQQQPAVKTDTGSEAVYVMMNHREKPVMESDPLQPDGQQVEVVKHEYDVVRLVPESKDETAILDAVRRMVLGEIAAYDESSAVNEFTLGDDEHWIPREMRDIYQDRLSQEVRRGHDTVSLDLPDSAAGAAPLTLGLALAQQMLDALNDYATDSYDQTQAHKRAVAALTAVDEVLSYDYTTGYPSKINFDEMFANA